MGAFSQRCDDKGGWENEKKENADDGEKAKYVANNGKTKDEDTERRTEPRSSRLTPVFSQIYSWYDRSEPRMTHIVDYF